MNFTINRMPIDLPAGTPLNVGGADGTTVRVLRGRVWVTQAGSVDDLFLDAGSGHTFRNDGQVLISAEGAPTATIVFDAPLSVTARETLATMVRRLLSRRVFVPTGA